MARGRPQPGEPQHGGGRPRPPPFPPPAVQEVPRREPRQTDAAGARSPLFWPKKRVRCRPKRLHTGGWDSLGGAGGCQNMSLLVIEFGVCHLSFLTWPGACTPHALPREGAPAEVED